MTIDNTAHDDAYDDTDDEVMSALEVIEGQPLSERAAAYSGMHDELARLLESGPREQSA